MPITNLTIPAAGAGCVLGMRCVPQHPQPVTPETDFVNSVVVRENQLGRRIPVPTFFRGLDISQDAMLSEAAAISGGRCPMVSWPEKETYPPNFLSGILAGTYDQMFANMAGALAAQSNGVILRLFWEMNEDSAFTPNPAGFVSAWQRVWTIIRGSQAQVNALNPPYGAVSTTALQAANALIFWCAGHRANSDDVRWTAMHPGIAYVDLQGQDVYNKNPVNQTLDHLLHSGDFHSTASDNDFYSIFTQAPYAGVPLMIGEFGCREQDDPSITGTAQTMTKPAWLTDALTGLKINPQVRIAAFWDAFSNSNDWRLDTDPATFVGNGLLAAPIGSGDLVLTGSAGSLSGYPSGPCVLQIGAELIAQASRANSVVTVQAGGRGWFGSAAAAHLAGAAVQYQDTSLTGATFLAAKAVVNDPYFFPARKLNVVKDATNKIRVLQQ